MVDEVQILRGNYQINHLESLVSSCKQALVFP